MAENNEDNIFQRTAKAIADWMKSTFPGHEKAFIGGLLGLVAALLFLSLGIGRALVVAFFVIVGVAIGQYLEGDPKILTAIRNWLANRR